MLRSLTLDNIGEPALTLAAAKSYLRVMHDDDDDDIDALIREAYGKAEARTGRQLRTATATLTLSEFPPNGGLIVLPCPPLAVVTSLSYYDTNGDEQTIEDFQHLSALIPGVIDTAVTMSSWPTTQTRLDAVTIVFECGGIEPEQIVSAIKLMLNLDYNEIEEPRASQMGRRIDALLHGYTIRDPRLYGITR
ncbi:MAG TPA: hypothetical protein PLY87_27395 [Planctomycetaceae bacterium]|nr:hypothetical protein [Planctomycetaceae bacterium]